MAEPQRTVGKTPQMAFVIDYMRQFPGAKYKNVKAAAQAAGHAAPPSVMYGNALRVVRREVARPADQAPAKPRRRRTTTGLRDLSALVEGMQAAVEERDRLRDAVEAIRLALRDSRV
jgi:hypothetical protein